MPGPSCKDVSELFNFNSVALIYDYKTDDNHRVLKTDSIEGHQLVHTSLKSVPFVFRNQAAVAKNVLKYSTVQEERTDNTGICELI